MTSLNIQTDPKFLHRLRAAAKNRLTIEELDRQRVSFIWGMVSEKSGITKEQIVKILEREEGRKLIS